MANDSSPNEGSSEKVAMLLIDDVSDFGFHAAYLAYAKAWTENSDENVRGELNKIMLSLAENRGDTSTFYQKINQYREKIYSDYSDIRRFKAQNKNAWRKSEAKNMRMQRQKR